MKLEAVDDLVDQLALGAKGQADQLEIGTQGGLDHGPVGGIVRRCEHLIGVGRRLYLARDSPLQGSGESWSIGAVDEDRFADQGVIGRTGPIFVRHADAGGIGCGDAAGQECCNVKFLPWLQIAADDDGNLGGKSDRRLAQRAPLHASITQVRPVTSRPTPIAPRQKAGAGRSFSAVTKAVKAATQRKSMTATAKSNSIRPAQQPMQNSPWRRPIITAPRLPSRHSLKMKPSVERQ